MERIRQLAAHLSATPSGVAALQVPRDDECSNRGCQICAGAPRRGPIQGQQVSNSSISKFLSASSLNPALYRFEEFLTPFLKSAIAKLNINPAFIENVLVGNMLLADAGYITCAAAPTAGLPHTTSTQVVNRFLSFYPLSGGKNRMYLLFPAFSMSGTTRNSTRS
jgi:hypothetical protein